MDRGLPFVIDEIEQIQLRAAGGERLVVAGALKGAADGTADHAAVAGHEDAGATKVRR